MNVPHLLPPHGKLSGKIGIGVSATVPESWGKILDAFHAIRQLSDEVQLTVFTTAIELEQDTLPPEITLNLCDAPHAEALRALSAGSLQGLIRGSLPSSEFLEAIKNEFQVPSIFRIALLDTSFGLPQSASTRAIHTSSVANLYNTRFICSRFVALPRT